MNNLKSINSDILDSILSVETFSQKADTLLSEFGNGHHDQELGKVYLISTAGYQFRRDAESISNPDIRLKIYKRKITRWLERGYRVVCTSADIGADPYMEGQVPALWGRMISAAKVAEILEDHGYESFDSPYSEVDEDFSFDKACWDRYNVGTIPGSNQLPMIEASRVFEWLGY